MALGLLEREELAVNGQADGLAPALVVEGAVGLGISGERQPPGGGKVGVPAQVAVADQPGQQLSGHAECQVEFADLQASKA